MGIIVASLETSFNNEYVSYILNLEVRSEDITIKIEGVEISSSHGKRIDKAIVKVNEWARDES